MAHITLFSVLLWALHDGAAGDYDSCTSVAVTAGASADGSTMVTHTSDCAQCDSRVAYIPARDWPQGTQRPIYMAKLDYPREVTDRSETYRPVNGQSLSSPSGFIPEVLHTYGYWEAVYGYMNEHGLALGESTAAANFPVSRTNLSALMWIRPLTQVAMERCKTARCAVDLMGSLAEQYGFYGEDPGASGAGECLTLVDGKETWVFEITGDTTGRSAFWAAKRVEEGHVVVLANNFIIRELDCKDRENYRCSTGLLTKAKEAGAWDGKGTFDWLKSMGPDIRYFSYTPGFDPIPYYTTARIWRVFSRVAPSLGLQLTDNTYDLPFSVRADSKISHRMLMDLKRDHYEGTEIDLTVGPLAGPFGSPNRMEGGVGLKVTSGQFARAISLPRTSYCSLGQTYGEKPTGPLNKWWFGSDTPASSVFVPFYANTSDFSPSYRTGSMDVYDDRSAWWVFNFVANWMDINYQLMSVDVNAKITELQDMIDEKVRHTETQASELMSRGRVGEAFATLTQFQTSLQGHTVDTWREFGHFLIMKYNDQRQNYPTIAAAIGYPAWWLQTFGVNSNIMPKWGQPSMAVPSLLELCGRGPFEKCTKEEVDLSAALLGGEERSSPFAASSSMAMIGAIAASYLAVFAAGLMAGTGRRGLSWMHFRWSRSGRSGGSAFVDESDRGGHYVPAPSA